MNVFVDLCCGNGTWTAAFKEVGFYCIGVDIEDHEDDYPGDRFIRADVRTMDGRQFAGAAAIVASPPCDEFAPFRMPWTRKRNPPEPSMEVVNACYRIRDEAQPGFFLLENVRSAQQWLGPAIVAREPFYFWGDAVLIPRVVTKKKESWGGGQRLQRAGIPFDLAYAVALSVRGGATCLQAADAAAG